MEFNEKLQELRKQKNLTQEELAERLYVSRTAISKWESGRGYPNIDSLKMISSFFSVTIDELLSSSEMLTVAEADQVQKAERRKAMACGILDLWAAMLLFLPLFVETAGEKINSVSLLALSSVQPYLKLFFLGTVIATIALGIITLVLSSCLSTTLKKARNLCSLSLGVISVLLFTLSRHPYAAVFSFVLLIIKVFSLVKKD